MRHLWMHWSAEDTRDDSGGFYETIKAGRYSDVNGVYKRGTAAGVGRRKGRDISGAVQFESSKAFFCSIENVKGDISIGELYNLFLLLGVSEKWIIHQ